ncbi:MAG: hypothetical protein ACLQOO_21765, partial [Terriglobia bacterium]
KVFSFRTASAALSDARQAPEISPQAVFLAAFYGFVFRLPSFPQLEADLAQPALQQWIGSPRAFGDDVLRYSLCAFDSRRSGTHGVKWTGSGCSPVSCPCPWPHQVQCPCRALP